MPKPDAGESEKDFVKRCIPIVIQDGTAKDGAQAFAICTSIFNQGKSVDLEALKIGARNSAKDAERLQQIHDLAAENGALCAPKETMPDIFNPDKALSDDTLLTFGTEVKALGDGLVGGYLVRFSDEKTPDLTGDFFNKETDFGEAKTSYVYYHHGLDGTLKKRRFMHDAEIGIDDIGVWIKHQLELRDAYEKAVYGMAEKKSLGWSSGTAPHLVDREPVGNAMWIKSWPLGLDASYTPAPAEPKNSVIPLKAYTQSLEQVGRPASDGAQAAKVLPVTQPHKPVQVKEASMPDVTTPEVKTDPLADILAKMQASLDKIEEKMKTAEPVKTGGVAGIIEAKTMPAVSKVALKEDQATEQLHEFEQLLRFQIDKSDYDKYMKATFQEAVASLGGNLVPTGYSNELVTTMAEWSVLRQAGARTIPISGVNPFDVPTMTRTTRASASSMRLVETTPYVQVEPTLGVVHFIPWKRGALYIATDEAFADSRIPMMTIIQESVGQQFADIENLELGIGNGSDVASIGQPNGIVTAATCSASIGSVGVAAITAENIVNTYYALPWQYRTNACWFMNDTMAAYVRKIRSNAGGGGSTGEFMWQVGVQAGVPDKLMGRPVWTLNTMVNTASTKCIVFADPRFYWIAEFQNGGTEFKNLDQLYAASGQTGWRFSRRYDGNQMVAEADVALFAI